MNKIHPFAKSRSEPKRNQREMSSKRSRSRSLFSLTCGCKDSKALSVSFSASDTSEKSTKDPPSSATDTQTAATMLTASLSSSFPDADADADADDASSTPTFSGLLRQLGELEKSVMEWAPPIKEEEEQQERRGPRRHVHRRSRSDAGGGGGRVDESVAVVKESEDPLVDFRRSMLQMIVEKEIVDGNELRELLHKFLQLNSSRHHDVIVRAFAEIWTEVFSGYENTPDLLRRSKSNYFGGRQQH